jgi:hypothetical protein
MRGALRPAIAVLLLVGVGITVAGRRVASVCPLGGCCAALDDADDDARADLTGTVPVAIELPARLEGAAVVVAIVAPAAPARELHVLADAPKTSPPTA